MAKKTAEVVNKDEDLAQLMQLKALTQRTGILHDAQVLQLKMWPLVLTHAVESEFTFKFVDKEVIFNITKTQGKKPKDLSKRLKLLSKFTKNLLGKEYAVTINFNNKRVFASK